MPVDLGDLLPDLGTVTTDNTTGALATPTTVTLTLTLPDGTTLTSPAGITVTNPSTGIYRATYETVQAGRHTARWVADGANCDGAYEQAWVVESSTGGLVSVDDALAHLGSPSLTSAQAEQLRATVLAATRVCGSYIGRQLVRESATETYSGGRGAIALRRTPVISVATVVESGTTLTASDWVLDTVGWLLHRGSTTSASRWASGRANVSVTYVAGYASPPADLRLAVLREVEHLWQRTQQAPHSALGGEAQDEFMLRDAASSIPWPVRYMLDPYKAVGIA